MALHFLKRDVPQQKRRVTHCTTRRSGHSILCKPLLVHFAAQAAKCLRADSRGQAAGGQHERRGLGDRVQRQVADEQVLVTFALARYALRDQAAVKLPTGKFTFALGARISPFDPDLSPVRRPVACGKLYSTCLIVDAIERNAHALKTVGRTVDVHKHGRARRHRDREAEACRRRELRHRSRQRHTGRFAGPKR